MYSVKNDYNSSVVSLTKNEKTEKDFDKAIDLLLAFEKGHNIIK
jgi:hypothetical protein